MWTEIFKFVGGSAVLLTIVGLLIRTLMQHFLSRDIEKFKYDIRGQGEEELERIKAALTIEALSHKIRFSKLHERRSDIIDDLFKRLIDFDDAAAVLRVAFGHDKEEELQERADKFIDIYFEFKRYFEKKEIYFSKELTKRIEELNADLYYASINLT